MKTSSIRRRIETGVGDAVDAGDEVRACVLRLMLAALRDREIAGHVDDGEDGIDDRDVMDLLGRMLRQREDSLRNYEESGRMELAEQERREIEIIRTYLPKPLNEAETDAAVRGAIRETNASSIRDLGKVMGLLKQRYPGRIDFCDAGARVKAALG